MGEQKSTFGRRGKHFKVGLGRESEQGGKEVQKPSLGEKPLSNKGRCNYSAFGESTLTHPLWVRLYYPPAFGNSTLLATTQGASTSA